MAPVTHGLKVWWLLGFLVSLLVGMAKSVMADRIFVVFEWHHLTRNWLWIPLLLDLE